MKFLMNWKNTKRGLILSCLTLLASCSTNEKVRYQTLKPTPIICPKKVDCQPPEGNIKTNGDLVKMLDKSLNTIEVCQIIITSLEHCIEQHNQINKGE